LRVFPSSGQVQRQLEDIRLGPINMQVLVVLLNQQGQVVSRNQLFEQVWKNQIVSDDTLTRCISDLRALLGHHQTHAPLIQTLPKRGYRWLPEVQVIQEVRADKLPQAADFDTDENVPAKIEDIAATPFASKVASDAAQNLASKTSEKSEELVPIRIQHFSWTSMAKWVTLSLVSLVILLIMTYVAIWIARTTAQTQYIGIGLLPSQISNADVQSIGSEIDHHLQQQILASKHLRYLSQGLMKNRTLADIGTISHRFGTKWMIESQISQENQFLKVSLSLIDSNSSLVLYEKSKNFRGDKDKPIAHAELESFSKEFILQTENFLTNNIN
ncbi:MAG: winged helix-turn-helix domain-containing protein, partial [Undibacterium sp.]|nr:winged helix-turn-helix domain-containing protein [Undibacterium sp.]